MLLVNPLLLKLKFYFNSSVNEYKHIRVTFETYAKKLFLVYMKFKVNWSSHTFIFQIWQPLFTANFQSNESLSSKETSINISLSYDYIFAYMFTLLIKVTE